MSMYRLIATTAFGLEAVVARELKELGYESTSHNGFVEFSGSSDAIARANLWLRSADRVLLLLNEFKAVSFEDLFQGVKSVTWGDFLPSDARILVDGKSIKSQLSSVPACQSVAKKAIIERLQTVYNQTVLPETGQTYRIEISLLKDVARVTLDTSGSGLHRRGYRTYNAAAPLRENLAAALVLLSRWGPHRPFADPFCGSGTIAIEAAMIGKNMAPGRHREFSAELWPWLERDVFGQARDEADAAVRRDVELNIQASDIDASVLTLTKIHVNQAHLGKDILIRQTDVAKFHSNDEYGCVVTNPPYGERLMEKREAERIYQKFGRAMEQMPTWSSFVITSDRAFEKFYGKPADKNRKLYNGRIETHFYQYLGPLPRLSKES